MQLPAATTAFNRKNVETILKRENKFITELLDILPLPNVVEQPDDDVLLENTKAKRRYPQIPNKPKPARAKSIVELQSRLADISSRKRLSYKEKLLKKTIKTKIKRKGKQNQRNADKKLERVQKELANEVNVKPENSTEAAAPENSQSEGGDRMVFSKFDFSGLGKKPKGKKEKHDPQKMLQDLQKQKEKVNQLRESGDVEKAIMINEKTAWKNALAKAQGEKVKDDEQLLAKTIQKREQQRQKSKKKWEARQEGVKKAKDERQQKRQENIDKRKKTKKVNKMKKAVKRGKIIPGF